MVTNVKKHFRCTVYYDGGTVRLRTHSEMFTTEAIESNIKCSSKALCFNSTTKRQKEGSGEGSKWFTNYLLKVYQTLQYLPLALCLLLLTVKSCRAFNIAPEASYVATYPQNGFPGKSAYFGYSVALLETDRSKWLLVGAPRANSSSSPNVFEPGSFFKCALNVPDQDCEEVVVDRTVNSERHVETWAKSFRNSSWTGAAIDIDDENNVLVCAPRWKSLHKTETIRINGVCYLLGSDLADDSAVLIGPLLIRDHQIYNFLGKGVFNYAHGQSGFSVHITDTKQLLIGAPGILNWQGSVVHANPERTFTPGGNIQRGASIYYVTKIIPNPIHTSKIQDSNYFGYSITSGKFDEELGVYFVGGAPRGAAFYGMVLIFLIRQFESQPIFIKEERQGTQLGEYFGAAVAAPDLNNDGYSELVVGAPLHSFQGLFDTGCVYVFLNNERMNGRLAPDGIMLLGDTEQGARFGTSLGTPGDLDNDGYVDLLVGAPYENEKAGAVYVFMGSKNGIMKKYSQKLVPKQVSLTTPLKGFGISFSRPVDLDGNYYPDFAVGSFLSDAAIVMLTRPVIVAKGKMSAIPPKLLLTHKRFTLTSCMSYEGNRVPELPKRAEFVVIIELRQESLSGDVVSSFSGTGHTQAEIHYKVDASYKTCKNLTVNLNLEKSDAQKPISVKMSFQLKNNERKRPSDPILSIYNPAPPPLVLSFITGCKTDLCQSDLVTSARFKGFDAHAKLVVGEMTKVVLEVDVRNKGEPAFLPNVTIFISQPVMVLPTLEDCEIKQNFSHIEIGCQLRNPLKREKDSLSFDLDVTGMDDTSPYIDVKVQAFSAADSEVDPQNNYYALQLQLEKRASLKVTGWSEPEQFTYERLSENELKTNGTETMKHFFSIEKSNETPLRSVGVQIAIPSSLTTKKGESVKILENLRNEMLFNGKSTPCEIRKKSTLEMDPRFHRMIAGKEEKKIPSLWNKVQNSLQSLNCSTEHINCSYIVCNVGPWTKGYDVAKITVSFDVNFTVLGDFMSIERGFSLFSFTDAIISSSPASTEIIGQRRDSDTVETLFYPAALPVKALAWWIYVLAILGGLLLLLLIAYILYKVGFFKRKDREKLEYQQASVRRNPDS